jgi:hypothetical protein
VRTAFGSEVKLEQLPESDTFMVVISNERFSYSSAYKLFENELLAQ